MEENIITENIAGDMPENVSELPAESVSENPQDIAPETAPDNAPSIAPNGVSPVKSETPAVYNAHPVVSANTRAAIEAMLFASDKPLTLDQIRKVLDNLDAASIKATVEELKKDYEQSNRGIRIYEVAGGYQMIANPIFAIFLKKLFKSGRNTDRLSRSAMETLAIIAYKQPLSKLEIESLRQVNVDGVMSTLEEKDLIRVTGRKKTPGRPKVYGTTRKFLEYFGLKSLEDLPKLENVRIPSAQQLEDIEPVEKDTANQPEQENNVSQTPSQTN